MQMCHASSFIFMSFLPTRVSCLRLRSVSYIVSAGSHYWQLKRSSVSQEAHSRPMWPAQHPRLNRNPVHSCSARILCVGWLTSLLFSLCKANGRTGEIQRLAATPGNCVWSETFQNYGLKLEIENTFQNKAVYACINYSQVLKDFFVISRVPTGLTSCMLGLVITQFKVN